MKKIIAIVLAVSSLFFLTVTKTLADWTAGVSVTGGVYEASGEESENGEIHNATDHAQYTFPSIFIEKHLGVWSVGLDYIPGSVESDEASRTDYNTGGAVCTGNDGCSGGVTNTAKIEIDKHLTLYAIIPIVDSGAFIKAGFSRMDVNTEEVLGTGSVYGDDTGVSGTHVSLGYQHEIDLGFVRAEIGYTTYDNIKVTSSTNANTVDADIHGGFAKISIGKSF